MVLEWKITVMYLKIYQHHIVFDGRKLHVHCIRFLAQTFFLNFVWFDPIIRLYDLEL